MNREIADFLKVNDVEYKESIALASISPIRIGGMTEFVAFPNCDKKLIGLVRFLESLKIRYKILGRMSNVLPPDEKHEGVIIRTDRISKYNINENTVTVDTGASLPLVSAALRDAGLSGFEGLCGIPGSVGGCITGNAGAFGREICDCLLEVRAYDIDSDNVLKLSSSDLDFSYRSSAFKNHRWVILSARFGLSFLDSVSVGKEMERIRHIRIDTQPTDKPSLGSTFKRPIDGVSAAKLIDDCGLKGFAIGGARISPKHAGFIVNERNATASDYKKLVAYVKKQVFDTFSIDLQPEVEFL